MSLTRDPAKKKEKALGEEVKDELVSEKEGSIDMLLYSATTY